MPYAPLPEQNRRSPGHRYRSLRTVADLNVWYGTNRVGGGTRLTIWNIRFIFIHSVGACGTILTVSSHAFPATPGSPRAFHAVSCWAPRCATNTAKAAVPRYPGRHCGVAIWWGSPHKFFVTSRVFFLDAGTERASGLGTAVSRVTVGAFTRTQTNTRL